MEVPDPSFVTPPYAPQSSVDVATSTAVLPNAVNPATTVSASGNPATKPKKKRSHTTPTRDRERRELLALRVESVELEEQLQQAREHLAAIRKTRLEKIVSSSSRIVSTVPAWRHIARRHLKARQEAEKENRRLREQLAEHLKWSNALQAKVNQRGGGGDENSTRAAATAAALGTVANPLLLAEDEEGITDLELELDDTDRAELDMLTNGLDLAFSRVDDVFKEHSVSGVPQGAVSGSRTTLDGKPDDGMSTVELRDTRVIPFDFKLVIDAAWNAWVLWHLGGSCRKSVSAHRSCSYPDVSRPEHTFAVKFRLQTPASKLPPDAASTFLDLKLVLRRYVEQTRLVLIWRGLSAGENDLDGLFTDETGWVVLEQMAPFQEGEGDTGAAAARTSMRSCVRMTPKRADDCEATPAQARILTNLVVNSYEEDVSFIYREMEAQLLRITRHV
ncbi:hypothetical protein F442_13212 [Phytophthora nicotianae P10297]|uniref:Uncharacterized protein n=4 Tax=Phytophthora nicotianae TaxID=4792 RepID=W2R763_PHYN3|nr:hypothetical protein PPTG_03361 [Phytophthora nicotianae INRA-310]ETK81464.1 hypothetical protein L915_13034 [Phytophthora nicotianae]ETN20335.1 hypothetical protein PPTG_03361 [Phytophthora nicotianae INRA-310]ETO70082.1 hypothetical protein F444_13417 [Phytophthora nicotianae P1976]ETP39325.1 hypothetical protein F442_13212 [Phytophthora nicotianae P10297]